MRFSGKFQVTRNDLPGWNSVGKKIWLDEKIWFEGSYEQCVHYANDHNEHISDYQRFSLDINSKATRIIVAQVHSEPNPFKEDDDE